MLRLASTVGLIALLIAALPLPPATAGVTPIALSTPLSNSPGMPKADVVIFPQQNTTVKALIGQTIAVARPEDYDDWQLHYNSDALTALTPPEKMRAPDLQGWLFRTLKPGETRIVLISKLPACRKGQPCPHLKPQRFVITLQVQQ
jgi:hypothetical protein